MEENITFHYENSEGLCVTQDVTDAYLTTVVEKFVWFIKAAGFPYVGAYVNEDGDIVITKGEDVGDLRQAWPIEDYFTDIEPEDYWGDLVDEVAKEFAPEAPLPVIEVGDIVEHTGKGTPDIHSKSHAGFTGSSLVGHRGEVIHVGKDECLVQWYCWSDGHGPDKDQWFVFRDNLKVLNHG